MNGHAICFTLAGFLAIIHVILFRLLKPTIGIQGMILECRVKCTLLMKKQEAFPYSMSPEMA